MAKASAPAKTGKTSSSKAVSAPVAKKSTAVAQVPDTMAVFAQHAGAGFENATMRDYALPFLYLLQSGSPQVKKKDATYVEGAEDGKFINTVTNEVFDELIVIPVDFEKVFNEWVPRDAGGGFVATYKDKGEAELNKREDTQIVDTANHYVLAQSEDGSWNQAILSLTSTKLKASRNWMSKMSQRMLTLDGGQKKAAPTFSSIYRVTAVPAKNDKGSFYTVEVKVIEGPDGWVTDMDVVNQALEFRAGLQAGKVKTDYTKAGDVVDAEVTDEEGKPTY